MYADVRMVARERPRAPKTWRLAAVLVILAAASTVVWRIASTMGFGRPFKVLKITAEPGAEHLRSEVPAAGDRGRAERQSLNDVSRLGAAVAGAKPVRRVDGTAFIASVEQASPLPLAQHTHLTNTFQLAAKLQATVDATDNPDTRADLQRRLDDQVRTRLRMILPKESGGLLNQFDEDEGPIAFQFRPNP